MKKYIITSFVFIFIIFGIGSGVTIYHLLKTTSNLRYLISLHEIEDIRQALSFSFQKIQTYTFSSPSYFADHLDEIIVNAELVNKTIEQCHDCHHAPKIEAELDDVAARILEYQEQLSFLITAVAEGEHRREHQLKVLEQGNLILNQVQGMVSTAADTVNTRTGLTMRKIDESYLILTVTLLLTFLAAVIVARFMIRRITKSIDELNTATTRITEGKLGYQTEYKGGREFKKLINTFNSMSRSLAQQENTIRSSLGKLHQLNLITLPLHASQELGTILTNLSSGINGLIGADYIGILVPDEKSDQYIFYLFDTGSENTEPEPVKLTGTEVMHAIRRTEEKSLLDNAVQETPGWPFAEKLPVIKAYNLILAWMQSKNNVNGALICLNNKEGALGEEDFTILGILANNMSVALENVRLLKEAQLHMEELKKT